MFQKIPLNMKIVFCVIALVQSLFADCAVGNLDDVNEADAELKEECEHLLGGGGIYIYQVFHFRHP